MSLYNCFKIIFKDIFQGNLFSKLRNIIRKTSQYNDLNPQIIIKLTPTWRGPLPFIMIKLLLKE